MTTATTTPMMTAVSTLLGPGLSRGGGGGGGGRGGGGGGGKIGEGDTP